MLSLSLIPAAHAATTPAPAGAQDYIMSFLPMILIVAVFYFLLIRPQQKRMKEHGATIAALKKGDRVILGGGMMATVSKIVDDNEAIVEIAEGVKVNVVRSTIASVINPQVANKEQEPAAAPKAKKTAAKK